MKALRVYRGNGRKIGSMIGKDNLDWIFFSCIFQFVISESQSHYFDQSVSLPEKEGEKKTKTKNMSVWGTSKSSLPWGTFANAPEQRQWLRNADADSICSYWHWYKGNVEVFNPSDWYYIIKENCCFHINVADSNVHVVGNDMLARCYHSHQYMFVYIFVIAYPGCLEKRKFDYIVTVWLKDPSSFLYL